MIKVSEAVKKIGIPVKEWDGACYAIACTFVRCGVVKGKPAYGHWRGPISPKSSFAGRGALGFVHHGWIELPNQKICDPTRWVFEAVKPYIYVGYNDYYDAGGNVFREEIMEQPPAFNPTEKVVSFPSITTAVSFLGSPPYCFGQLFWLANLPLPYLGEDAKKIYTALKNASFGALVPIDNYRMVME